MTDDRCFSCEIKKGMYSTTIRTMPPLKFFLYDGKEYCESCYKKVLSRDTPQFK